MRVFDPKNLVIALLALTLLTGCATRHPRVIYREIPVPIACTVPYPPIPTFVGRAEEDMVHIATYVENLYNAFRLCKGD